MGGVASPQLPMKTSRFSSLLPSAALLLLASSLGAQTVSDPRITSWFTAPAGRYARLYESDAAKSSGDDAIHSG